MTLTTDLAILRIRDLVNAALCAAYNLPDDQRFALGAINWGDLDCVDVEHRESLLYPGEPVCVALVEEASPEATGLQQFVRQYLLEHGLHIEVETAW